MKKIINTDKAPAAIGPYSQAVVAQGLVFTSGQLGIDTKTGNFAGEGVEQQAKQAFENLKAVLEEADSSLDKIIKTTCFLSDMDDFAEFNKVYESYITTDFPARSCFAVKTLPKNAMCEIEAVAVV